MYTHTHTHTVAAVVSVLETSVIAVQMTDVTLTCTATGQPSPLITWLRHGEAVPTDSTPRLSLETGVGVASLTIVSVLSEDGGEWVCHGDNIAGSSQESVTLTVLSKFSLYNYIHSYCICETVYTCAIDYCGSELNV